MKKILQKKCFSLTNQSAYNGSLVSPLELENFINSYKGDIPKEQQQGIFKGVFAFDGKHSINSHDIRQNAPFLCFDVDVKHHSNPHLCANPEQLEKVWIAIKKIAFLAWRSSSGKGIAGVLYAQGFEVLNDGSETTRKAHQHAGAHVLKQVQRIVKAETGLDVEFDPAQSKLRQIRYLTPNQSEPVKINHLCTCFEPPINEIQGQIIEQHHKAQKNHEQATKQAAYINLSDTEKQALNIAANSLIQAQVERVVSATSVHDTLYKAAYHAAKYVDMVGYGTFVSTFYNAASNAYAAQGRATDKRTETTIKSAIAAQKKRYSPETMQARKDIDYQIQSDYVLVYDKHVSELNPQIIELSKQHDKILIHAQTGGGKTTAIQTMAKYLGKTLIAAPLTIIAQQLEKKGIPALYGSFCATDTECFCTEKLGVATYEKTAMVAPYFDTIVIDEIHNIIGAQSYKAPQIKALLNACLGKKIIGLSATPTNIFKSLGYKIITCKKRGSGTKKRTIKQHTHTDELKAFVHYLDAKNDGQKCIIKLDSKTTLQACKDILISRGETDINIYYSSDNVKDSQEFKNIVDNGQLTAKYTLTTSLLKEGFSLNDNTLAHVVIIENQYNPNPLDLIQFNHRQRDFTNIRLFHYYKLSQTHKEFNIIPLDKRFAHELNNQTRAAKSVNIVQGVYGFNNLKESQRNKFEDYLSFDKDLELWHPDTVKIAYEVEKAYFKQLSHNQYNRYVELNSNYVFDCLGTVEIEDETPVDVVKEVRKQRKQKLIEYYTQSSTPQDLLVYAYHYSDKGDLKHDIKHYFESSGSQYRLIVAPQKNHVYDDALGVVETIAKRLLVLKKYYHYIDYCNSLLFDGGKLVANNVFSKIYALAGVVQSYYDYDNGGITARGLKSLQDIDKTLDLLRCDRDKNSWIIPSDFIRKHKSKFNREKLSMLIEIFFEFKKNKNKGYCLGNDLFQIDFTTLSDYQYRQLQETPEKVA